jgi:dipeptidyl aminopeptidase/acylaminoacyl peptidase
LIPIDGGEARKAASLASDIAGYSFSPEGSRAAVLAPEPEDDAAAKQKEDGFNQRLYEEDWRPTRAWVVGLEQENEEVFPLPIEGSIRHVSWSPVDDRLLISVTPTPSVDDSYMRQRIKVVEADTGNEVASIDNTGKLGRLEWSPNGRFIGFISAVDMHDPSAGRLMVARVADGKPRELLPDFAGQVEDVAWLNNRTLMYLASEGVRTVVGRVSAVGQAPDHARLLGPEGPAYRSLALARRGRRAALVGSAPNHPDELFTLEPDSEKAERRTNSNPWLSDRSLAKQEIVRYRARDGLELEGILIRPLDEAPGKRYPLILCVHGGPEAHVNHGWQTSYSRPGQVAAARGMAVFYPNYRGSTGRGVDFSKLGQGDPAGKEFDDLVDAVDHLIDVGLAHPEKIGVTGGSYGGYATGWCCTRYSERFAAGVMFVGISDKVSKVGTTDIPDEEYYVHALKRPWEMWDFLLERSPIYHAGNARTPLLILHGEADPRVHVSQSLELYRHVKLRGQAPVRLVLYPGEGHGNRNAAARLDYQLRMLRWFEHYLVGPGGKMPAMDLPYDLPEDEDKEPRADAAPLGRESS